MSKFTREGIEVILSAIENDTECLFRDQMFANNKQFKFLLISIMDCYKKAVTYKQLSPARLTSISEALDALFGSLYILNETELLYFTLELGYCVEEWIEISIQLEEFETSYNLNKLLYGINSEYK